MAKTVCIIGLAAAKSLLHDAQVGTFEVTIFDGQSRIGGLWPSKKDDMAGLVHPLMVANQSRHTVQFSDLAWEDGAPQLPRAWQVGQYLERYRRRYCQDVKLHLGCRVQKAERLTTGRVSRWKVCTQSRNGQAQEYVFDYLLIASGFFGKPARPQVAQDTTVPTVPIIHSSAYRDLIDLVKTDGEGGKIVVVGGQMSGVEIAATIASQISSATHQPGNSPIPEAEKYSVHHVISRQAWTFPLYTSPKPASAAPPFLPLDLGSYNIANRLHPLTNTQGHISREAAKATHSIYRSVLGSNQTRYFPGIAVNGKATEEPQYVTVSDNYTNFVRSGLITLSHGKLATVSGQVVSVSPGDEQITNVAAIVLATGFEAASSISFLPHATREMLSVSASNLNNTISLAFHGTYHPDVANLGFVGFYRSPYWGVIEMQARFLAALWAAGGPSSPTLAPAMSEAVKKDRSMERTMSLRSDARASQFPMGDYLWLMQEFAAALGLAIRSPLGTMPRLLPDDAPMDILTPARYPVRILSSDQEAEVDKSLRQTEETVWAGLVKGKFVAKAVFRSLLGTWKLERDLVSTLPSHPSGHFSGTARFLLRQGTRDGREAQLDAPGDDDDVGLEYLYVEEGDFTAANGPRFRATRRYVWRYDEMADRLSVWFARTDDQKRADCLFHELEFVLPAGAGDGIIGWEAKAGHLCVEDFYHVRYDFRFDAVDLRDWTLAYSVKGPKKDYNIDGLYRR